MRTSSRGSMLRFSLNDLYVVVVCVSLIIGGVLWLGSIESKASIAESKATTANEEVRALKELVLQVNVRSIRIEESLKYIENKIRK